MMYYQLNVMINVEEINEWRGFYAGADNGADNLLTLIYFSDKNHGR